MIFAIVQYIAFPIGSWQGTAPLTPPRSNGARLCADGMEYGIAGRIAHHRPGGIVPLARNGLKGKPPVGGAQVMRLRIRNRDMPLQVKCIVLASRVASEGYQSLSGGFQEGGRIQERKGP